MQTLSKLLAQVEGAIEVLNASSLFGRPTGTGRSSRPPTNRGTTAASTSKPGTATQPPPDTSNSARSGRSGRAVPSGDSAQLLVVSEAPPPRTEPIELVRYVGLQSHMPGRTGRRHIDARAAAHPWGAFSSAAIDLSRRRRLLSIDSLEPQLQGTR